MAEMSKATQWVCFIDIVMTFVLTFFIPKCFPDVDEMLATRETRRGPHWEHCWNILSILAVLGSALEEAVSASDGERLHQICIWCNDLRTHRCLESFGKAVVRLPYRDPTPEMQSFLGLCRRLGLTVSFLISQLRTIMISQPPLGSV